MSWMKKCYSRLLIDNHITDLKPEFMQKFDSAEYVRMVKIAGVDSVMIYACCHNGNCYYPTKTGHRHANLNGRDILGETVTLARRENIVPIAYYTVIFHNDSAKNHPEWRQHDVHGKDHDGRYYYSCPNHPDYVTFAKRQLSEIAGYDIEGIFIDMTFWPMLCQCDSCRGKYHEETGKEIPAVIDWNNQDWVAFQRARERWMAEFASDLTNHIKTIRPELSVTHQFSPVMHGWFLGQSAGIADASDYASGDFYGGKDQHRIGAKIFAAYSRNAPYEFMTSRCVNLGDHTSTKSEEELLLHAATTLANGGAYFFIDAINPDGTLNEDVYQRLGKVVKRLHPFKDCIQRHTPVLHAECGLYFSMESGINEALNGIDVKKVAESGSNMDARRNETLEEIIATSVILNQLKIPYQVITDRTTDFTGLRTLIVNNALCLSKQEVERIRLFVRNGGTLIATGMTSFYDSNGRNNGDFQLADVFGVSFTSQRAEKTSYLQTGTELISCLSGASPLVNAVTAKVEGTVVQPYFPAGDPEYYASIHSDPPGIFTDHAGLTVNHYGQGICVYLYSSLLKHRQESQQDFGRRLFRRFLPLFVTESENLPFSAEVTLLRSEIDNTLILGLVNYQDELPNIPALNLRLKLRLPENFLVKSLTRVANREKHEFKVENGLMDFKLNRLDNIELFELTGE